MLPTRREVLGILAAMAGFRAWGKPAAGAAMFEYRARATVLVLSLPLLSRDGVGDAYLRMEERELGQNREVRLSFGAGSLPERAAGLNRLGVMEESVLECGGEIRSASYFGFMTASPEADAEQARAALREKGPAAITAIRGRIEGRKIRNRLLRVAGVANSRWAERQALAAEIQRRLEDRGGTETEVAIQEAQAPGTFLYAIRCVMRAEEAKHTKYFVHNGEVLRLETERKLDRGQGAGMVRRGLVESAEVWAVTGKIYGRTGKGVSEFRVWYEAGAANPAPVQFEFRPQPFLRLAFERVRRT